MSKVRFSQQNIRDKRKSVPRYIEVDDKTSVAQIVEIVRAKGGSVESATIQSEYDNSGWDTSVTLYVDFESPETDEEWAQRLKEMDEAEAREKARKVKEAADKKLAKKMKEERERAEYERLKAKFEKPKS